MTQKKAEIFLTTFDRHQLGHDLRILAENATIEHVIEALSAFALQYLSDCRGCDGCCYERIPLTAPDLPALAALLPPSDYPVTETCRAFAEISVDKNKIVDITLKRDPEGACVFLHKEGKYCQNWQARPFVCRSHFCLPKSQRLADLRGEITNLGENELIRLLLEEQAAGAPPLLPAELSAADYPPLAALAANDWQKIFVKELVSADLWQALRAE